MKIKELDINGIGGINKLSLQFNDGVNMICGVNGVGKTTILTTIADAFAIINNKVKRGANFEKGHYTIDYQIGEEKYHHNIDVSIFDPTDQTDGGEKDHTHAKQILTLWINRDILYQKLTSIPLDAQLTEYDPSYRAVDGIESSDLKAWFCRRYLFLEQDSISMPELKYNFELAKNIFKYLDNTTSFSHLDYHTADILLNTPGGKIFLEYLSSGYKTCLFIIWGIIKEIESRFSTDHLKVKDFDGVILIDEIDLHLHPTWQAALVQTLRTVFPNVQFIMTTHSPSILQSLEKDEIIALSFDKNGNTAVKELSLGEYGLQGWTLEEIMQDVMEMPTTTSKTYQDMINAFDKALYDEDYQEVKRIYAILDKMLHPDSTLRRLLKIQMAGMED